MFGHCNERDLEEMYVIKGLWIPSASFSDRTRFRHLNLSLPILPKDNDLAMHNGMSASIKPIIRLLLYFSVATTAVATRSVSGWDGLACGDFPQLAKQFVWEQEDEVIEGCATFDPGPKTYSMIAETDTDDVEVWAYALPGCRGSQKQVEATCTNPDISFPYFVSYKVILVRENKD